MRMPRTRLLSRLRRRRRRLERAELLIGGQARDGCDLYMGFWRRFSCNYQYPFSLENLIVLFYLTISYPVISIVREADI